MEACPETIKIAGPIIVGFLLSLTEILPFIKKFEYNGIAHFFYTVGSRALTKKKEVGRVNGDGETDDHRIEEDEETGPLLWPT